MGENKTSQAQIKASREYEKRNDRINVVFPAGTRERMQRLGIKKHGRVYKRSSGKRITDFRKIYEIMHIYN